MNIGNLLNYYNENDELQPNTSFGYSRSRSSEKAENERKQRIFTDYTAARSKSQDTKNRLVRPKKVRLVRNEDLSFSLNQEQKQQQIMP